MYPLWRRKEMASLGIKGVIGACIAGSLMISSTAAGASTGAPVQQVNPWGVLTAMSGGAPAAAVCGAAAAAAAAQAPGGCVLPVTDVAPAPVAQAAPPPPVPVAPVEATGGGISPLVFGLLALAAGVGIYLAVHHVHHANSPA
jgi:hypothetical protein